MSDRPLVRMTVIAPFDVVVERVPDRDRVDVRRAETLTDPYEEDDFVVYMQAPDELLESTAAQRLVDAARPGRPLRVRLERAVALDAAMLTPIADAARKSGADGAVVRVDRRS